VVNGLRTEEMERTILKIFGGNELHGYEITRILAQQGVEIELSRLYRILNAMQKKGLLNDRWEKSRLGPRRRMYSISDEGEKALNEILLEAIDTVHSFYGKYLQSLFPRVNVVGDIIGLLSEGLGGQERIALLTDKYSIIHEIIVSRLQEQIHGGMVYVVKPSMLDININLENVSTMNGSYNDIPFKNGFIDRLMVVNLPNKDILEESAGEWRRVIKNDGRVAIVTPTILVQNQDDPLTIGDFVEMHEHQIIEKEEHIEREVLMSTLENIFQSVVHKEVVHMSIFFAH